MRRVGPVQIQIDNAVVYTASTDGNFDVTDIFKKGQWVAPPTIFMKAVEDTNGSTLDIDFQVSMDNGTTYKEVLSLTQLSATGNELAAFTIPPWGEKVRMVVAVSGGGGQFTVSSWLAGQAAGAAGN